MKHIQNFYVHTQPDGNELKWVGTTKNNSQFEIRRSTDEIDFTVIKTLDLNAQNAEEFNFFDNDIYKGRLYYQVAYYEGETEVQISPAFKVENEKKRFNWVKFGLRALVAIALIAIVRMATKKIGTPPEDAPIRVTAPNTSAVKLVDVTYKNFNTQIEALGQVISTQPIDIVSEVSGRILKGDVVLRKANRFKKNALLFSVDNQEAILNLKSQRSNLLNAIVLMLTDLKLDFPNEFEKWNSYFQTADVNRTLAPLPTIANEREKIFISSKNILGQYYSIKSAEERLTKYAVYAPYGGIITDVYTDVGGVANLGTRVVRVMRTDQLELELPIRKEDIRWVKVGTKVRLYSEDKRQSSSGFIVRISNTLDPSTQSINAYVSVGGRGIKLYEGMYLNTEITGRGVNNAMEIDRRAVFEQNKVFVMQSDSTLRVKTVKIHKVNTETVLFSGLVAGEKVVNDNLLGLSDGVKIIPLK